MQPTVDNLLNLKCNVPLTRGLLATVEPLVYRKCTRHSIRDSFRMNASVNANNSLTW